MPGPGVERGPTETFMQHLKAESMMVLRASGVLLAQLVDSRVPLAGGGIIKE